MGESTNNKCPVLSTATPELFEAAARRAAGLLRAGELVALPTETVYGLAANALDAAAVARIFEVKGRPAINPIIVHVASLDMARRCASAWPEAAQRLAEAFWPGPLTLVLPKSDKIPGIVTAQGPTVGVRWPSHPFIQAVIRECGFPLAAPSANPSNQISPTTAGHVRDTLGGRIALVVDGGPSGVGIESTVLDVSSAPARLLRPGMISAQALEAVLGAGGLCAEAPATAAAQPALRSPGMLRKHYSPQAQLVILNWADEEDLKRQIAAIRPRDGSEPVAPSQCHVLAYSRAPRSGGFGRVAALAPDAAGFARTLYAELHECDALGARLIVVEAPPKEEAWRGIWDRLTRASAG